MLHIKHLGDVCVALVTGSDMCIKLKPTVTPKTSNSNTIKIQ